MRKFKEVSAQEFDAFIAAYPRKWHRDRGPFGVVYMDDTLGTYPDSVFARYAECAPDGGPFYVCNDA